ncbi:MAG: sulfurtransferase TusA family protein [Gammaproteobacteria bacterium]|nr:sulfurtransferase TusA family protein [Gammaproteobacteria bacterium]
MVNRLLPILRTKKALAALPSSEGLLVAATDPGSVTDPDCFCAQASNAMLSSSETDGEFYFRIRKA